MFVLAIKIATIENIVFIFSFLLLAVTIYYCRKIYIGLRVVKEQQKKMANRWFGHFETEPAKKLSRKPFVALFNQDQEQWAASPKSAPYLFEVKSWFSKKEESLDGVKKSILLQQQQLNALLQKVDNIKNEEQAPLIKKQNPELQSKIDKLELLLEEQEDELQKLRQGSELTQLVTVRMEEVQRDFDALQKRLAEFEKQAATANQLAMDLEDIKEEYSLLQNEHRRKQEKLQETTTEKARLYELLCQTEDKLQVANKQRHQFMKRARVLEEMNTDFQTVSDTNLKMKTELRRIGELESMLNMMTQERDHLLRRQAH